jgi:hypothetical protein
LWSHAFPRCAIHGCGSCQPWVGESYAGEKLNREGLWRFAHDWLRRLAPFAPRARGALAARMNTAFGLNYWDAPHGVWSPAVLFDVLAPAPGSLPPQIDATLGTLEWQRSGGHEILLVQEHLPVEIWLRRGPGDELPELGPVATLAELEPLLARAFRA